MTPPSDDEVIPNFITGADQPVAPWSLVAISGGHLVMRLFPAQVSYPES